MILSQATITKKIISLSNNCIIIWCTLVENIDFQNGQFVVWQYPIGWKMHKRSYSIYNCFEQSENWRYLEFHIKRVAWWIVSNHIIDEAQIWDSFDLIGWVGKMTIKAANSYLFVWIWSWLSPLHSLFDSLIQQKFWWKIWILYWERFLSDLIPECINSLPENSEKVLKKICLSQDKVEWLENGRIQFFVEEMIDFVWKDSQIYLCGKPEMVDDIIWILYHYWFDKQHIHFEKY